MSDDKLTALDVFKMLPKTNCGECGSPTCMAFAVKLVQQQGTASACPYLDEVTAVHFDTMIEKAQVAKQHLNEVPNLLKERMGEIDFSLSEKRLKARVADGMLAIKCLGRDFLLDRYGELHAECHSNFWVHLPLLNYAYLCKGKELTGEWVKYDQLRDAMSFSNYFATRCEASFKKLADENPELFFDILRAFGAKAPKQSFSSDVSHVIYPLPRVPLLICYWKAEEEFESVLSVFFDRSAEDNIDVESIYVLGLGMVEMFKKFILTHGHIPK